MERHAIDNVDFDVDLTEVPVIQKVTGTPIFQEGVPTWSDENRE